MVVSYAFLLIKIWFFSGNFQLILPENKATK